jgi:hypothetical protein
MGKSKSEKSDDVQEKEGVVKADTAALEALTDSLNENPGEIHGIV